MVALKPNQHIQVFGLVFKLHSTRTAANRADFLAQVEHWRDSTIERVYAIVDNLSAHQATDVLLFSLAHPRWEFVFQPIKLKEKHFLNFMLRITCNLLDFDVERLKLAVHMLINPMVKLVVNLVSLFIGHESFT